MSNIYLAIMTELKEAEPCISSEKRDQYEHIKSRIRDLYMAYEKGEVNRFITYVGFYAIYGVVWVKRRICVAKNYIKSKFKKGE